jgi:hypothetical protein
VKKKKERESITANNKELLHEIISKQSLQKVKVMKAVKALQKAKSTKQNSYVRSDTNIQDNYKKLGSV